MPEFKTQVSDEEEAIYKIVEGMVQELSERKWGIARLEVSMQGGKIVTIRRSIESVLNLKK